ncbi:hypothetical protein ABTY98_05500 [Streptomyces sp. NPDC096040]|uniref:hypothetical protein n=1 Tax=Streptomyces sp. NPDC096040 TaxID=3155541 RepID=UPI00332D7FE9
MARSIRFFLTGKQGTSRANLNWAPINRKSAVIVTAAEFPGFPGGLGGLDTIRPSLGAASIWVSNVGVHGPEGGTGGVEFLLHVDWGSPLDVMVTVSVLEDIEEYDRVG